MSIKPPKILSVFLLLLLPFSINAHSVEGIWVSYDDKTNKPRSEVLIWESYGKYYGKILKVYRQKGDKGYCTKCPGAFKGKPIKGLTII